MEIIFLAVIVLFAIGVYFFFAKRKTPQTDFNKPEKVLAEVEVYLAYGRRKQAIALLENAIAKGKASSDIVAKLHQVRSQV